MAKPPRMSISRTTISCLEPGGRYGEEKGIAPHSSGRDSKRRRFALDRAVRNPSGEGSRRLPSDASRHSVGAQDAFRRYVPEALPVAGRIAGSVDAVAGSLRPEDGGKG